MWNCSTPTVGLPIWTNGWAAYLDGRRFERFQPGTPRHLPVPAVELEVLGLPVYTYGGDGPDM